jgi:hypothetical protein
VDECLIWPGSTTVPGYGKHRVPGENRFAAAHRTAYEAYWGPIPAGRVISHTCDNRLCYNPLHLIACTQAENVADRERKGRGRYGPNAPGIYGKRAA